MFRFIIGIILGILVIFFVTQNTGTADITLLFWTATFSRAVMYIIIFVLGFFIGWLVKSSRRKR